MKNTSVPKSNDSAATVEVEKADRVNPDDGHLSRRILQEATCTDGFVECENGFVKSKPEQTCQDACEGKCCVDGASYKSCAYFTGSICKDGSCDGNAACLLWIC